jgi:hypothetical protein
MYVTISVSNAVSMRGRHVGHASTYHRSAQPVRKAWRGKSCCCDVNNSVVQGRRMTLRTSRAVGAAMLASVDNHCALGLSARGASRRPATAGRSADKGSRTSFAIVSVVWCTGVLVEGDWGGWRCVWKDIRRCAVEVHGRVCRVVLGRWEEASGCLDR